MLKGFSQGLGCWLKSTWHLAAGYAPGFRRLGTLLPKTMLSRKQSSVVLAQSRHCALPVAPGFRRLGTLLPIHAQPKTILSRAGMKPASHFAAGFRRLGTRLGPAARLSSGAEDGAVRATDDTANENLSPEEDPLGRKRKAASTAAASGGAAPDAEAERAAAAAAAPAAAEPPPAAPACGASGRRSPSPAAGQARAAPSSLPLECMCTGSGTRSHRTCCLACWHLSTRRFWVQY